MQISLEVDVREKFHKEMPIHSNCLVSETVRLLCDEINQALPEGTTVIAPSKTRRYLCEQGLFGRVALKKPFIRQQNRKTRLTFAQEHKDWSKDDWNKVLWTDESKFELFASNRRLYMCGDAQVSGSLTTAFPLPSNMGVEI